MKTKSITMLLMAVFLIFSSCKKDRTCTCNWTIKRKSSAQYIYSYSGTKTVTVKKTTKKIAKKGECSSYSYKEDSEDATSADQILEYSQDCKLY